MATLNAYATLAELRTYLADSGSALDASMLERALTASSRSIDRYCGRRFWKDAAVAVRTYVVEDCRAVSIDDVALRTGLVVKTSSDGITFGTTLVAGTDFILEPNNADVVGAGDTADPHAFWRLRGVGGYTFPVGGDYPTLQVTARFGWSAVPYEVQQATLIKAASLFKRKDAPFGVASFGDFGAIRIGRNDPDVVDLLAGYTLPGFA